MSPSLRASSPHKLFIIYNRESPARLGMTVGLRSLLGENVGAMSSDAGSSFTVELDNSSAAYVPGEVVRGAVRLDFATEETLRGGLCRLHSIALITIVSL